MHCNGITLIFFFNFHYIYIIPYNQQFDKCRIKSVSDKFKFIAADYEVLPRNRRLYKHEMWLVTCGTFVDEHLFIESERLRLRDRLELAM